MTRSWAGRQVLPALLAVSMVFGCGTLPTRADSTSAAVSTPSSTSPGNATNQDMATRPSITSLTVMLYYDDLAAAERFYGRTLGLDSTNDFGWAKFFRISPGAEVGIVKAGPGAYFTPQPRNAVMLSIVTEEVDAWYSRLKAEPAVVFLVDIHTSESAPIRNFIVQDPGGYAVEFFQWLRKP